MSRKKRKNWFYFILFYFYILNFSSFFSSLFFLLLFFFFSFLLSFFFFFFFFLISFPLFFSSLFLNFSSPTPLSLSDFDSDEQIEFTQNEDIEVLNSFDTMGLKEDLLRGIYAYGPYFLYFSLSLSLSYSLFLILTH